jgi:transitional endoplasmic reticulum ATPase
MGLVRSKAGRICLYGPPGTGKSAFARWVAEQLGSPLHVRRVSDLVSPFVGMTEKNMARAFREAQKTGAVLLLDEVDSFLQDRRAAQRSWEVTAVNEMLTQMEGFSGVFIATTNLMEDLDQAALRRFDLKLRFGYLESEQARRLFESQCEALGMGAPSAADLQALGRLEQLTPGDFAAAARQHRFRPLTDPADLVDALVRECELKEGAMTRMIGFR